MRDNDQCRKGERAMHNLFHRTSTQEEIDVIIHLTEEPAVLQKQNTEVCGIHFTAEDAVRVEARIDLQQQQVLLEMAERSIPCKKVHKYKTV